MTAYGREFGVDGMAGCSSRPVLSMERPGNYSGQTRFSDENTNKPHPTTHNNHPPSRGGQSRSGPHKAGRTGAGGGTGRARRQFPGWSRTNHCLASPSCRMRWLAGARAAAGLRWAATKAIDRGMASGMDAEINHDRLGGRGREKTSVRSEFLHLFLGFPGIMVWFWGRIRRGVRVMTSVHKRFGLLQGRLHIWTE